MEHGMQRLDAVALVLYQPQDVVNVAAIIRAMSNFGLTDLRLVEPAAFDPYRIAGIAHHTEPLIERTRRFPTLDAALADCGLVLGTTGRPREIARPVYTPRAAAPMVLASAGRRRAAILFGPEQDGLPNAALDRCHGIISIPTHPFNRSLNLAQAALVVAYELWMAACFADARVAPDTGRPADARVAADTGRSDAAPVTGSPSGEDSPPASGSELQALFGSVDALLQALYPGGSENRRAQSAARLRALLMRAVPRSEEAAALTNLMRHAARASARQHHPDGPGR